MFKGWLKGIGASIIGFIGIMFIIYSIIQFLDDNTSGGTISIIIGIGLSAGASYLKYVSSQTVKTTKK
tara:strand:+ start:379 stop:582 length:204 start_codon:yes stop_codon:yes gene_type:complete